MKSFKYFLLFPILLWIYACTAPQKITETGHDKEPSHEITAAFKNAEKINDNNLMLIFRRADNCQYIIFSLNRNNLSSIPYSFLRYNNEEPETNSDYINLMFNIKYTGKASDETEAQDVITFADSITIEKTRSDRFISAGFDEDTEAEKFIIELKDFTRNNEAEKILLTY